MPMNTALSIFLCLYQITTTKRVQTEGLITDLDKKLISVAYCIAS